jgi:hypothetical protein
MRGTVAILVGVLILLVSFSHSSQASSDFSYNVNVNYRVTSDANTRVTEIYNVTNHSSNKYLSSIQLSTPTDDAKNIVVEYSDGSSVPFTLEKKHTEVSGYPYDYTQININFNRQTAGAGTSWNFTIRYDTSKLVETKGGAHTVYIPAISQDVSDNYQVQLSVPQDFGTLHTTGARPTSQSTKNNQTTYSFDKNDLREKSLSLVFGDSTVYKINFNYPLNNQTPLSQIFTIALPPNTSGQQIILNKLDPQPDNTRLDADGNILADYTVPAHTKITVQTNVQAVVRYIEYDLTKSGTKADIPNSLVSRYTGSQQYWPANNPTIAAKAHDLTKDKKSVSEQVQAINNYVIETLSYNNEKIKYNIRQGGLKALENPTNVVCLEYSDLTISLLRAAGIPARMPIGYGYSGDLKQSNSVSDSLHSWVQAYVPGIGWMNVDPTWGEKFNNFGSSDLDHVAFAIWGQNDDAPSAVTEAGRDTNYQYEATTISYQALPESVTLNGKLSGTKWQILPFVSLVKYNVQAPTSTAGENYVLESTAGNISIEIPIGSLAPQQKTVVYRPEFGLAALRSESVVFSQSGQTALILATTQLHSTSWPMWLILAIIAGIIIWKLVQLRPKKAKPSVSVQPKVIPTIHTAPKEEIVKDEPAKAKPPKK